jgi:hypothetical protein
LLEYRYTRWIGKNNRKIEAVCKIFKEKFAVDHFFVKSYGSSFFSLPPGNMYQLVDENMVKQYPMLLPTAKDST